MKPQYLVHLYDSKDKLSRLVWLKSFDELKTFLVHVDVDLYIVGDITATEILTDWKDFCKTDKNLEHGGNTE